MQTLQTMYDAEYTSTTTSSAAILSSNTNRIYSRSLTNSNVDLNLNKTASSIDASFVGSKSSRNSSHIRNSPVSTKSDFLSHVRDDDEFNESWTENIPGSEGFTLKSNNGHLVKNRYGLVKEVL